MFSFPSFIVNVVLLLFTHSFYLSRAAGAPLNVTIRFDNPLVSFSPGWNVADFGGTERKFAFTDKSGEELQVVLPRETTALFYQGFKATGGSLTLVCLDCASTANASRAAIVVDAHDSTVNGTQPPITLFSFTDLDPKVQHVLNVVNLQDDRFNHTSQATFDSVVAITGVPDNSTTVTTTSTSTIHGGIAGGIGLSTIVVTDTATTNPSNPTIPPSAGATDTNTVGNPNNTASPSAPKSTSAVSTTSPPTIAPSSGAGTQRTGGSQSRPDNQSTTTLHSATSRSASATGKGGGDSPSQTQGSSAPSNNNARTGGVSKPVIIAVAVIVSLVVLALLAAIIWLLMRNQPRASNVDMEGQVGLMREATPAAAVAISGPVGLAPVRPWNPFADTVPPDVPLEGPEPEDILAAPVPRPPPPPIPPKSPLRAAFMTGTAPSSNSTSDRPSVWLSRRPNRDGSTIGP